MALNVLQRPTAADLYRNIQAIADQMKLNSLRITQMAEFLNRMSAADLTAMDITDATVISLLTDFRVVINEEVALFNNAAGAAVTPTKSHVSIVDQLRHMLIV